jgi:hypothetical protein
MSDEPASEREWLDAVMVGFRPLPLQRFPERLPGVWVPGTTAETVLDSRWFFARTGTGPSLSPDARWLWIVLSLTGQFLSVRLDLVRLAALMEEEVAYVLSLVEELEATGFFHRQARADGLYLEAVVLPEWLADADRRLAEVRRTVTRRANREAWHHWVARPHRRQSRARARTR